MLGRGCQTKENPHGRAWVAKMGLVPFFGAGRFPGVGFPGVGQVAGLEHADLSRAWNGHSLGLRLALFVDGVGRQDVHGDQSRRRAL